MEENTDKKLWFKRKTHGWGWTPCSWEGWLVTLGYIILIVPIFAQGEVIKSVSDLWLMVFGPFIILTGLLFFACYKKGEKPKWQWGNSTTTTLHPQVGVGAMIFKDGKVLVGKRTNSSHANDEYCFPGGHLEYMESFEDCARRETMEEAGITIKNIRFNFVANQLQYLPKHYVNISFIADWESGEARVMEPDKFEAWDWCDIDQIPEPLYAMAKFGIESYKTGRRYYDKENNL